jgi:hypothetical protein
MCRRTQEIFEILFVFLRIVGQGGGEQAAQQLHGAESGGHFLRLAATYSHIYGHMTEERIAVQDARDEMT